MQFANRPILALVLICGTALAAAPLPPGSVPGRSVTPSVIGMPASEESVQSLLEITGAHKLIDEYLRQVDERIGAAMQGSVAGRNLTPEQEAILIRARDKASAVVKEAISWEAMEAMSVRIYREALTQGELDGMLAFYRTPAGEAVTKKMPRLMQELTIEMQGMMQSVIPKLKEIDKELEKEMKLAAPPLVPGNSPSDAVSAPSAIPVPGTKPDIPLGSRDR
jgi:uncharacterized protein